VAIIPYTKKSFTVVVVVVVEGSLVPPMRKTGPEGHYTVNH